LDWIRSGVEYKLKKETLNSNKLKVLEYESRRELMTKYIAEKRIFIKNLDANSNSYKNDLAAAQRLTQVK
jgi:hypothetical protein